MALYFNSEKFANELKKYRGKRSQQDVSSRLGTNRTTLSLFENNKQIPSLDILQRFCELTNSNVDNFFVKEQTNPIIMMMGQVKETDKHALQKSLERIKIKQKYIAIGRRCERDA